MSRIQINIKQVASQNADSVDIRVVSLPIYPAMSNDLTIFYGFYEGNSRIESSDAEGNIVGSGLVSQDSLTDLLNALISAVGDVTEAVLAQHQIGTNIYTLRYKQGVGEYVSEVLSGTYITEFEVSEIKSLVTNTLDIVISGNDGFAMQKSFIVNSASELTDYNITFTIHNTIGTDTATDVYVGDNVRSDWGDIRVKSGGTYLPYAVLEQTSSLLKISFLAPSLSIGDNTFALVYNRPATSVPYKIACLTDTHYDPNTTYAFRNLTLDYIDSFVARMATYQPDLAVNNGDKIGESNNTIENEAERLAWYQLNMDHFAAVSTHAAVVRDGVGVANHDTEAMYFPNVLALHSAETWMQPGVMYGYWESADFRFISLDSNYIPNTQTHITNAHQGFGYINTDQLSWLESTLAASTKPCLIFVHHPLCEMETGIIGLTKAIYHCQNRAAVRAILEASGKVACVLQGHMHWFRSDCIKGIPYIVMEDISYQRSPDEFPLGVSGKWNLIEIDKETCTITAKLEAKTGVSTYSTYHTTVFPYKTIFEADITNAPDRVFAAGYEATYGKASILTNASQLYVTDYNYVYINPLNAYYGETAPTSNAIQIRGTTNAPNYGKAQFYFAQQSGSFKIAFAVKMTSQATKMFMIGNGSGADTSPAVVVTFNSSGNIVASNGASVTTLDGYSLSVYYNVVIVIHLSTQKFSVLVDGNTIASVFDFTNANATLNQMQIQTETGDCYIDNLRMEKYTSIEPVVTDWGVA